MTETEILKRLDRVEAGLAELRKRAIDGDLILTTDDHAALSEAEADLAAGRTSRLC